MDTQRDSELSPQKNEANSSEWKAEHDSILEGDFHPNAKGHVASLRSVPDTTPSPAPDGGWGWLVVSATFVGNIIQGITLAGFSILYIEWIRYFQCDSGVAGWIGSIHICSGNVLCVLFSRLTVVYGSRSICILGGLVFSMGFAASFFAPSPAMLYVTYGLVAGLGSGMFRLSSSVIVQQYFNKRRALASAIALAGNPLGALVSGPLYQFLISSLGWRGSMMVMAGVCLNTLVVGAIYRPLELNITNEQRHIVVDSASGADRHERTHALRVFFDLLKTPVFVLCLLGNFFMQFGFIILMYHSPNRAFFYGIDRQRVALLPTIRGVTNVVSRLLFGFVANLSCVNRVLQYGGSILAAGVLLNLATLSTTYLTIIMATVAATLATGSFQTVQGTVLVDLIGMRKFPMAMSLSLMVFGVSSLLATPAAGNYEVPFYFGGLLEMAGGVLIIAIPFVQRQQNKKQEKASCREHWCGDTKL